MRLFLIKFMNKCLNLQVLHHHQGRSYPDDVPKFLGTGTAGNFEPPNNQKVTRLSRPGENGKGHQLRVEQKTEEERLKGVYGFNQLVSDEITLNRYNLQLDTTKNNLLLNFFLINLSHCRNWSFLVTLQFVQTKK